MLNFFEFFSTSFTGSEPGDNIKKIGMVDSASVIVSNKISTLTEDATYNQNIYFQIRYFQLNLKMCMHIDILPIFIELRARNVK